MKSNRKKAAAAHEPVAAADRRSCILEAAYDTLSERGYGGASTLEIATRAKVSKRELYAEFGNKQGIIAALVNTRAARMRAPLQLPAVRDRGTLEAVLRRFGATMVGEVTQPPVIAMFRLAAAEAENSPEVARTLDSAGREASRAALSKFLAEAQSAGLLEPGDPLAFAGQFLSLLLGDLPMRLLLGVAKPPSAAEIERRAHGATEALLKLHGKPA